MNPAEFLTVLWGPTPPGLIQIWQLDGKRSSYYKAPAGAAVLTGRTDIYTAVSTAHKDHGRQHRGRADQALAIPGLWLDLDINGGPDEKAGAIADLAGATHISATITRPTLLISSGYGLHAWYLFDEPWKFASVDDQNVAALASAQWYSLHRQACATHLWGLDHAHDLARLLRLPGTINGKGGNQQPVEPVYTSGPRYSRQQLLTLAAAAGDVPVRNGVTQLELTGPLADITANPGGKPEHPKLQALIENVPEFADTWNHQLGARAIGWTLSEYDLSLCTQAHAAGFTEQELADLIAAHRHRWAPGDQKAGRLKYIQRTVQMACTPSKQQAAMDVVRRSLGRAA